MTDGDATAETTTGREGAAARGRARVLRLRRRRAAALVAIAIVALGLGMGVGAVTGGSHLRTHPSASRARGLSRASASASARAAHARPAPPTTELGRQSAAINRTLTRTPYVRLAGTQHRELALTFDDGPGPYTPQILRILRRTHTRATFFEVGEEDRYFSVSTRLIVRLGDPIGDHTYNHESMSSLSYAAQQRELLREAADMGDAGAPFPRMFRPPYGDWDRTTLRLLRRWHMLMVLWSVDTDDWQQPGTGAIVHSALQGARPGAIILMHDAGGDRSQTVAALPTIIRGLRRRGYRLVTVPRLLLDNPAPVQQDVASLKGQGG